MQKPEFVILQDSVFTDETGDYFSTGYNIAEIFIKNYLDILQATVELPPEQLTREKKMIMELEIYPLCIRLKKGLISLIVRSEEQEKGKYEFVVSRAVMPNAQRIDFQFHNHLFFPRQLLGR